MEEFFIKKGKYTFKIILFVLLGLGYLWCLLTLPDKMFYKGAFEYGLLVFLWFTFVFLLWIEFCFVRSFVKLVLRHHPALVITDSYLQVYDFQSGSDLVFKWQEIRAIEPFQFKGNITYNVHLKDFDGYLLTVPSRWHRFCLRMNAFCSRGSIVNIDCHSIDADKACLLDMLNQKIQI